MVFIFGNEIWAENQIGYNMAGEAASFGSENNSAKIRITMDTAFLQPHLEKPERFTISLESDEKLDITSFKYGDAVGGTSEIVKTQFIDIALIKTYSDLENTKSFTDVQNLSITTDKLLINPLQDVTASIYSDTISVSSSHNVAFPDTTKFAFGIPKGSTEYYIVFSDDAEIIIDGTQYTPVDGWEDKAVILTLDSIGLRSLSTTGNFFIESQWKDLKIDWQEKFDFIFYDIKGELSIDDPKILSLDLARADDVILRDVRGEVIIKKLENTFQVSSRGIANTIERNEKNILDEDWILLLFNSTILQLTAFIILPIGTAIVVFFKWIFPRLKEWKLHRDNRKFVEDGRMGKLQEDMADYFDGKFDK